jgi:NAD(P)H-hydrate repair Nnr-like enzyme with NAD(P)H-hydrate dehydratase domain
MAKPGEWQEWDDTQARGWIAVPTARDDKYTRGVLGMRTGSEEYPGAAVLGVEAAFRTGVGMVRYLGPRRPADLVLQRRPEVVTMSGRVQAWLLGSGVSASGWDPETASTFAAAVGEGLPTVLDAGALALAGLTSGPTVITPHFRELAVLLSDHEVPVTAAQIAVDPAGWAVRAAETLDVTVLLKGAVTRIASPSGARITVSDAPPWLATAGTGDVLGGILGALVTTHAERAASEPGALAALAATASLVHSRAAAVDSAGGPLTALGVAEAVPAVLRRLLNG